ncbi:HNH endonuclease signature motif containing protein [Pseudalkalibacillus caeni]|uniref:HNH endonuclease n=1 Tax=Exobacillus caeni TaxID=2574798 RepID=A0A5R9F807_9BACL|nr:HNH endonuclease signature motif containing protein [Pseudalkalibacillus caeni]TLS37758.1 HNH endonuclease [Pseudalkalibacillus caeni]
MPHRYTTEQVKFLTQNIEGRSRKELHEMFNDHFGLNLNLSQITSALKNRGLSNGLDSRFKPGRVPFNKGKTGPGAGGWEPTQFKKGHKPHNYKPVGTERVNGDGYVDIKIADPNKWRTKHNLIWEKENGPVPKGHVVIFGDGNRYNFDLDNLILVSRKQLAMLNKHNLIQKDADLTRTGVMLADLYRKIGERKKAK